MDFLATAGLNKRVADDYGRQQKADAFTELQRTDQADAMQTEAGLRPLRARAERDTLEANAGLPQLQSQESRASLASQAEDRKARDEYKNIFSSGGTLIDLAGAAKKMGRMPDYQQFVQADKTAREQGMHDVIRAARMGATGQELAALYNKQGAQVKDIKVEARDGDIWLTATMPDGSVHAPISVNKSAQMYGVDKPAEFHSAGDGLVYNKNTGLGPDGKPLMPRDKPKDYMIELKRADGSSYLVDARDSKKMQQMIDQVGEAGGIDKEQRGAIWKSLLSGKGEFESMAPDLQKKVWDGYNNAVRMLGQYKNLDPGMAGIFGFRLATGEMTEEQLRQQPEMRSASTAAPSEKPPMEGARKAPDGKWYVQDPKSKSGWALVEPDSAPEKPAAPAQRKTSEPVRPGLSAPAAPAEPPASRVPVVGAVNDSVGTIGRVLSGGPTPPTSPGLALPAQDLSKLQAAAADEPMVQALPAQEQVTPTTPLPETPGNPGIEPVYRPPQISQPPAQVAQPQPPVAPVVQSRMRPQDEAANPGLNPAYQPPVVGDGASPPNIRPASYAPEPSTPPASPGPVPKAGLKQSKGKPVSAADKKLDEIEAKDRQLKDARSSKNKKAQVRIEKELRSLWEQYDKLQGK